MEKLGNYLREEREKQGKTLDDISCTTRISRVTLQAIESGADEKLPPASYLRGFVKLYAQELGLSVDDVLEHMPKQSTGKIRVALPRSVDLETPKRPWLKILLIIAALCAGGFWVFQAFFDREPFSLGEPAALVSPRPAVPGEPGGAAEHLSAESTTPLLASPQQASEKAPAAKAGLSPESPPEASEKFSVRFAARGVVWMKLQSDDGSITDITLREGEWYRAAATRSLQVRLGNPALVDVWFNDTPVSLGGTPGLPLDVRFPDIIPNADSDEN